MKADEIKQMVLKIVDLSLDLVDMAEECLDPEKLYSVNNNVYVQYICTVQF